MLTRSLTIKNEWKLHITRDYIIYDKIPIITNFLFLSILNQYKLSYLFKEYRNVKDP